MIVITILILSSVYAQTNVPLLENIENSWWSHVQKDIATSEYEIRWQPEYSEYQSPNRAQNLRFSYYLDGFKVRPRVESDLWSADIRFTDFGHEGTMESFKGSSIVINKQKGCVKGNGIYIEYENSEKGMREDFVVQNRTPGEGELILEFSAHMKNLTMTVEDSEIGFVIDESGGQVLRYGDMTITDSECTVLKGHFKQIDQNGFAIVIEEKNAEYPIRIDPLSQTPDWTAESDQAEASFGYSVSTAGDVNSDGYADVIVGALSYDNGQTDEGRAYVYHGYDTGSNEYPSIISYPDMRLSIIHASEGMVFKCSIPVGLGFGNLVIYDLLGTEINRIELYLPHAGDFYVEWHGQDENGKIVSSGVYFARVITPESVTNTSKFVLTK